MSTEHLTAGKYAHALLLLAQEEGKLEEVRSDLDLVKQLFGQGEGRELLLHPLLPLEHKNEAIKKLLQGRVTLLTLSLLRLLVEKRRGELVSGIAAAYQEGLQRLQGRRPASVTSSIPLTAEQFEALRQKLSELAGVEVELTQVTDPALRGGARIKLGDLVLDGTIGGRLEQLRRALSKETSNGN